MARFAAHVLPVALVLALLPIQGQAQVCGGNPALGSNSRGNIGGGVAFFDGGKGYGASATFGSSVFGSVSFSHTDFDDTTLSLKEVSAGVGYDFTPPQSSVSVCPAFGVGRVFGLELLGVDITAWTFAPAVSMGVAAEVSPTVSITPFGQLALIHTRANADAGLAGEANESGTDGAAVLGATLTFNGRLSIGPAVRIPIATDGGDTSFGVGLSVALGRSD